jgi:DNA-binding CsgD family transcriptional regulator
VRTVLDGGIWIPPDVDLGSEHDTEIAGLIARLQTLTPQQGRVLGMLAEGLLNKQIAYELSVSEATIKAHVSAVLQKLGVDSRTQAVIQLSKIGAEVLNQNEGLRILIGACRGKDGAFERVCLECGSSAPELLAAIPAYSAADRAAAVT